MYQLISYSNNLLDWTGLMKQRADHMNQWTIMLMLMLFCLRCWEIHALCLWLRLWNFYPFVFVFCLMWWWHFRSIKEYTSAWEPLFWKQVSFPLLMICCMTTFLNRPFHDHNYKLANNKQTLCIQESYPMSMKFHKAYKKWNLWAISKFTLLSDFK